MLYIFCNSFISVPSSIYAIEKEKRQFRILSTDKSITKLFSELYSSKNVFILPSFFESIKNPLEFIREYYELQKQKKKIVETLEQEKPDKIIFYFVGFCGFESWLISKFATKAQIFYRPAVNIDFYKESYSIKARFKAILMTFIFRTPIRAVKYENFTILALSKKFLKKINALEYNEKTLVKTLSEFAEKKFPDIPQFKILFLIGKAYNIDEYNYLRLIRTTLGVLTKIYEQNQIAIKQHPSQPIENLRIPQNIIMLPKHLPANLLSFKASIIISYASGTLFEAANIGKKAISIMGLIESSSPRQNFFYKKYLTVNSNELIYFPKSMEEFEQLVRI